MTKQTDKTAEQAKNPLKEIIQPFIDVVRAPRALWGVNLSYLIEGFCYFGVLGYLAMYFNEYVGLSDTQAGPMVGVLTWGITLSMFFFGGRVDKWGVRRALLVSICLMIIGRAALVRRTISRADRRLMVAVVFQFAGSLTLCRFGIWFISTGSLRCRQAVHYAKDRKHGLRHALRPYEPWRLAAYVVRTDPEVGGNIRSLLGLYRIYSAGTLIAHRDPFAENGGARYNGRARRNGQG